MRNVAGTLVGVAVAGAIACGAATPRTSPPQAPSSAAGANAFPSTTNRKSEIEQLDAAIRADLARMGLPEPTPAMSTPCTGDACSPQQMGADIKPHAADPTCQPGTTDTCRDACKLADAICANASKICTIATDMGDDAWANGKCADGKTSCDNANKRCCGCQV